MAKQNFAHVTVLIAGAGPSGSFLASNLARMGIQCRIIDKLKVHTTGRAIGVVARTLEILEHVVGSEVTKNLVKNGHPVTQQGFWRDGKLTKRTETWDCDSLYNYYLIHPQLGLEDELNKDINKFGMEVEYGVKLTDVFTPEDPDEPILCTLRNEETGKLEYITCKYLIGADGAHSFVRRSMAVTVEGETPNMVWGIIDAQVKTDFKNIEQSNPDIANDVINYRDIRNYLSIDQFIEKITAVFTESGYKLEIGEVKWFSIFKIQEKIASDWTAADGRVILVGDACHTHSPGGGLGMQAGIMDSFNLAWKLNLIEKGFANRSILNTYVHERKAVAAQFIETSAKIIRVMSNMTPANTSPGLNSSYEKELALLYRRNGANITTGPSYPANELCWDGSGAIERDYAFWKSNTSSRPGQRAPDVFSLRQYNTTSHTLSHFERLFKVTRYPGIFNILIFARDLNSEVQDNIEGWARHLEEPDAFYSKYKSAESSVFAFHTITFANKETVDDTNVGVNQFLSQYSTVLLENTDHDKTSNEEQGLYGSSFLTAAEQRKQSAHAKYGISDNENGAIIVLRPDGYIGAVVCLEDWAYVDEYFDTILGGHDFAALSDE
ncbi:hypothetical protein Unana1_03114 [Umbelopsis nana]